MAEVKFFHSNSRQRGFTLPETLIAIFILATVMSGVLVLMTQQTRTLTILEQRAFANIVAENVMTETMMLAANPEISITKGEEKLANADWTWTREVTQTGQFGLVQIQITVTLKNDAQELARLITRRAGGTT